MAGEELKETTGDGEQKPEDFEAPKTGVEEVEMPDDSESKEGLQPALQILKEASAQFNALCDEASNLENSRDFKKADDKWKERLQLLIDLPDRLAGALENVDRETKQQILGQVSSYAGQAKGFLAGDNKFGTRAILTSRDDKSGSGNSLERLIERLESK